MRSGVYVLGVDPGLASMGVAVARVTADALEPVNVMVARTQKAAKKQRVRAADDNLERLMRIAAVLRDLVDVYEPVAICAESMSFPRNASNAGKTALCWGALGGLVEAKGLPLVQVTPQEIKLALTGERSASKGEVQAAVEERMGLAAIDAAGMAEIPQAQREHPYDALAAIVACEGSEVIRMARQMAGRRSA